MVARNTLINRRQVRIFLLEYAARSRSHKFTRVGDGVYDVLEAKLRDVCRGLVDAHPSVGRTLK